MYIRCPRCQHLVDKNEGNCPMCNYDLLNDPKGGSVSDNILADQKLREFKKKRTIVGIVFCMVMAPGLIALLIAGVTDKLFVDMINVVMFSIIASIVVLIVGFLTGCHACPFCGRDLSRNRGNTCNGCGHRIR